VRLVDRLAGRERSVGTFDVNWYLSKLSQNPFAAGGSLGRTMSGSPKVEIDNNFVAFVDQLHRQSGPISSAVAARALVMSQLRFKFRSVRDGDAGRLFGTQALAPLERPGTVDRPTLLYGVEQHNSYAGNAYVRRDLSGRLHLLRPDWVSTFIGSDEQPEWDGTALHWPSDATIIAYGYTPGGASSGGPLTMFNRSEIAHWMPEPDPTAPWRGLSWVQSVIVDALLDRQATDHQSEFFKNAATPQIVFTMPPELTPVQVKEYAELMNAEHAGAANAYKNLYIGGGADVKVVGADLAALSLRDMQGGFETRVAVRARIPAAILGVREGLAGSALNSGNYGAARRMWTDGWFAPAADSLASCFERIVDLPGADAELTYDASKVMMLQEDRKDEAEIQGKQAGTIRQLVEAGFSPESAKQATITGDFTRLEHTGLYSVQLQSADKQAESQAAANEEGSDAS
jgi:hypothetical protein